ncbi:hypothetical protein [Actinomadura sp. SCN-SB]|uniref:hypothetical protein n=1 Tax=Actinomadura sp. SCN-SB TaxID=3373092 RepID=UPI0037531AF4
MNAVTVVVVEGAVLIAGAVLGVIAHVRGWRPSVRIALLVGVGLRVAVMGLAAADPHQPVDLWDSFLQAGQDVLHRRDPVLTPDSGWHFLPMSAYGFALTLLTGLPWEVALRLYPMAADIVLIVLVGRLARDGERELRRFQYACSPLAMLVCAVHGQLQSVALVFGVAAFLAARSRRPGGAGALMGFALSANSWPVMFLPGIAATLRRPGRWLRASAGVIGVPALFFVTLPIGVGTPIDRLPDVVGVVGGIRPVVGDWGWTAVATGGHQTLDSTLGRPGSIVLFATLFLAGWWWRRADPIDLTIALVLAFLIVTPRLGAQYLLMPVPFLLVRSTRAAHLAMGAGALWAAFGYLYMTRLSWSGWQDVHVGWSLGSLIVIAFLIAAMPWRRRVAAPPVPESMRETSPERAPEPEPAAVLPRAAPDPDAVTSPARPGP